MEYQKIIKVLNEIERDCEVDLLAYKGIRIWPLIRLEIWKSLYDTQPTLPVTPRHRGHYLRRHLTRFKEKALLYTRVLFLPRNAYPTADTVFMVAPNERRVVVDGKYYSPYSNSLQEMIQGIGMSTITLDVARKRLPVYGHTHFLNEEMRDRPFKHKFRQILDLLLKKKADEKIVGYDNLKKYISLNFPQITLRKDHIAKICESIIMYQNIFKRILKKINPKIAFLVCYYHPAAMGYIRACRKLNVPTVEIQHGEQHGMYRDWINIPPGGYDTMPHSFWCWGKESAKEINNWSQNIYPEHHAFVVGNPWISKFITKQKKDEKTKSEINVLVALNKEPPTQELLKAIKNSPYNIKWLVRIHPVMIPAKDELTKEFLKTGNKNIEVENTTSSPLFNILRQVDFLITPWSTVAYEALIFGVHPIITAPYSKEVAQKYISKGLFSYADTSDKILKILQKNRSSFNFHEKVPYMETDIAKIKNNLLNLIKS